MSAPRARRERRGAAHPAAIDGEPAATAATALLALAIAGTALLVDVRAAEAFDAPKRLAALLGIAGAAGCMLTTVKPRFVRPEGARRLALGGVVVALVWAVIAALASPHAAIALDGLRTLMLFALVLPLGASNAIAAGRGGSILAAFIVVAAVNASISLLQAGGLELFDVASITGRTDTGAFLGNEGHLAQVTAIALVATVVLTSQARTRWVRVAAGGASVLYLAALAVNRNLTALATVAAGVGVALVLERGRRALVPIGLVLIAVVLGVAAHPPFRARVTDAVRAVQRGDWDALTTYRLGPWTAALEMIRERPFVGFGPGTFGAEFTAHRLRAELRYRRRFVVPILTSNFGEAHSEYLQAAAEGGTPAAMAVLVALAALLTGLTRIAADPGDARRREALLLVAVLVGGAVASLTWFPMQRPLSAVPLLLAAGRGWRVLSPPRATGIASRPVWGRVMLAGTGVVVLAVAVTPELARYAAERRLATVIGTVAGIAARGRVVPEAAPLLEQLATTASATADTNPGDTRGLVAAGTAYLVAGHAVAARAQYRAALLRGERPEIDLDLARTYALEGRHAEAEAALLRAAWLSPALARTLPAGDQERLEASVDDLAERLARGALATPPALPEETALPPDV